MRRRTVLLLAYGLDMTDEMLLLPEQNRQERGFQNARFLKGHIEQIPLPENSVAVVISNCVINLSSDKPRVLREAFPGAQARWTLRRVGRRCPG